jgi:cell division protein FtsB
VRQVLAADHHPLAQTIIGQNRFVARGFSAGSLARIQPDLNLELAVRRFTFDAMKRVIVFSAVMLSLLARTGAQEAASNATPAAAIAAKEGAEERYERLAADIQALQAANDALQSKVNSLSAQLSDLRSQQVQDASNSSVQNALKLLAEREEDKQSISEQIRQSMASLQKALAGGPASNHAPSKPISEPEPAAGANRVIYVVKSVDNLSLIVNSYNADFKTKGLKRITIKQAKDANPDVDWPHLQVGQKIVIPVPEHE